MNDGHWLRQIFGATATTRLRSVGLFAVIALVAWGCTCGDGRVASYSLTGPDRVVAGEPATFVVDGPGLDETSTPVDGPRPEFLAWYFEGSNQPNPALTPPKTGSGQFFRDDGFFTTWTIDNEERVFAFAPGEPGTERTTEVSVEVMSDPAGDPIVFSRSVVVETPEETPPPPPPPPPDPTGINFGPPQGYGAGERPSAVAAANFHPANDRDDIAVADDVAAGGDPDVVNVYKSNGDGTLDLGTVQSVFLAAGADPLDLTTGDWDKNGTVDIASANAGTGNVTIVDVNSAGTATVDSSYASSLGPAGSRFPQGIDRADFDGDTNLDIVAVNTGEDTIGVLPNGPGPVPEGVFGTPVTFETGTPPQTNDFPHAVAAGDFNGDGAPDVAVANLGTNGVTVLRNTTAGGAVNFAAPQQVASGAGRQPAGVASADFNSDGKPDLAVANNGTDSVSVLLNTTANGSSTFSFSEQTLATGDGPNDVAIGFYNGDALPDFATINRGSDNSSVFRNTAGGVFASGVTVAAGDEPVRIASARVNADAISDLVIASSANSTPAPGLLTLNLSGGEGSREADPRSGVSRAKGAKALKLKVSGSVVGGELITPGDASFTEDGVGVVEGALERIEVKAKLKGKKKVLKKVPKGVAKSLNSTFVAEVIRGQTYPAADGDRPLSGKLLLAGVSAKNKRMKICMKGNVDSRPEASKKRNRLKMIGGTGPLGKLRVTVQLPKLTRLDISTSGTFKIKVSKGKKQPLSQSCKALLKKG